MALLYCMGSQHKNLLFEVLPCYTHTSTYRGSVCCMWETALFCPKILNTRDRNWGHSYGYHRNLWDRELYIHAQVAGRDVSLQRNYNRR